MTVDYKIGLTKKDHSDYLEIVIDDEAISHAMKEYGNKEETGVITGRKKFDTVFEMLSRKMATIKRHFFASPYEMMLDAIAHNEKSKETRMVPNLSYNLKPQSHERIWIIFNSTPTNNTENQFSVFYGISFDNISEQQLCKIFFSVTHSLKYRNSWMPRNISITHLRSPFSIESSQGPSQMPSLRKKLRSTCFRMDLSH